jgi:RNA polymerase sigma-70 factor, ECF subfamily
VRTIPYKQRVTARASTDAELLAAVSAGDLSALGALYDRYAGDVWRVLERVMYGSADVEDVVHATFLTLPRIASNFDGRTPSCRNWLYGVATRLALRHGRGLQRFTAMLSRFVAAQQPSRVNPESVASGREELDALERAVADLSPKKRAVFVLVECEGLSHIEVAEALRIPLPTVRTRLFGAKDKLRAALRSRRSGGGHEDV